MKFNIILEPAEEGGFNVSVPALDGCYTQGDNEEEAVANAGEAILCYLEGLEKTNQIKTSILAPISTEHIFSLKLVETGGNYESDCPHEKDKRKTQRRDGPATIAG